MIRYLKLAAAVTTTAAVLAIAPANACALDRYCNQCYCNCLDAYMNDSGDAAETRFSMCLNACTDDNGFSCQVTAPGG